MRVWVVRRLVTMLCRVMVGCRKGGLVIRLRMVIVLACRCRMDWVVRNRMVVIRKGLRVRLVPLLMGRIRLIRVRRLCRV